ncbi:hypothetical protein GCM10027290_18960 [Micromonospora sonneratiae]|jgi:hypothetical protein|uniref:Uncharacterized protein n=1 Tax=Micromonospora sonneratiae TaxID=1184706 RepID=A0ABW3Y8A1_9ACTN
MDFLLAFVVAGLAATGGWLVWGAGRFLSTWRRRRHELRLARIRATAEIQQKERELDLRERELANETYQDFVRRHPEVC